MDIMCEFRAGKMSLEGTRVIPDTRKGLVRIGRAEEGLVHFQWLDRAQDIVEDDQIVFPEEAVFEKVTASSGRVYILKFRHDDRKFFFWMQEPNADQDSQICIQVNTYINQPLDAEADLQVPIEAEMSENTADDDISSRAGNLVDQSMTADLAGEVTSAAGPVRLEDLQRILSAIQPSGAAADPDAGLGLADILKPELVLPLLENLPVEQLTSHLPEGQWTPSDILELFQSPPLRQQVDAFTHVLRTGQIDLAQFGVDPSKCRGRGGRRRPCVGGQRTWRATAALHRWADDGAVASQRERAEDGSGGGDFVIAKGRAAVGGGRGGRRRPRIGGRRCADDGAVASQRQRAEDRSGGDDFVIAEGEAAAVAILWLRRTGRR